MKPSLLLVIIVFFSSFILTWLVRYVALRKSLIDIPNERSSHTVPKPRGGGIAIVITWFLCIVFLFINHNIPGGLFFALLCGLPVSLIGLLDDILKIDPRIRFLIQISAAAGAVLLLGGLSHIDLGFEIISFPVVLSILAVVGIVWSTNLFNFLDGIDGYASAEMIFIGLSAFLLMGSVPPLYLAAMTAGFLIWNWQPAKIFMGDAGSMLLGFSIATLMILFGEKIPRWWMASIVVFGLPILDTAVALVRRFINKRPLFLSDRGHIYDQMIDRGIPLKKTVAICYGLAAIYAAIGILMSQIRTRYALIVYIVVFLVSGIVVWKKGYLKMEGLRGAIRKEE